MTMESLQRIKKLYQKSRQ